MTRLEPGISRALAADRSARLTDVACTLRFALAADPSAPIRGDMELAFTLRDAASPLVLDFRPAGAGRLVACDVGGRPVEPILTDGHVILPPAALTTGRNNVTLAFVAGDAPLNRRDGYLYTVFVPARAHEAFPCFDQPDLKVRWRLTLALPDGWRAVANAGALPADAAAAGRPTSRSGEGGPIVAFAETAPISTYLFAFAAGRLDQAHASRDGRTIGVYHRASESASLAANVEAIAAAHRSAIAWLEDYTGIAYPFGKLDVVLVPDFQFGGMEHPGAIFYNQSALLLTAAATRQQQLARAHVIAHETAHMWFGNLVTMPWFDDVWLKEVCANFMAARIVNPQYPDLDHDLRFLLAHYPGAYDVDRTAGANAIRQPLDNLADAGSLYGAIVYLKSPIVLRQLELLLGEDGLRQALRHYLSAFSFGCASWTDLLSILCRYTDVDLERWSRNWIDAAGRPVIAVALLDGGSAPARLSLEATDQAGRGLTWPQLADVAIGTSRRVSQVRVWLDGAAGPLPLPEATRPDYVLPNGRGLAYGEFRLDPESRAWLLQHLPALPDALTRGSAWLTLWDSMLSGSVAPGDLFDLALSAVATESSELTLQRILTDLQRLFWIFVEPDERGARAAAMEAALIDRLDGAQTPPLKAAVLATFRAVATTASGVARLHQLWASDAEVPGLVLGEQERVELAKELAVRSDGAAAREILDLQYARTGDADRRAALIFLTDALLPDSDGWQRFLTAVSRPENRRRERWVIEGAGWLHHPLHADAAVPLIRPGLDLLAELRRTGDIFLPKRWADATLGGHRSAAAASAVDAFLADAPPDYPDALRRVVLASADHLRRQGFRVDAGAGFPASS